MWCFISEPNGIIHEIFLPKNAVGQECLDKVRNYNSAILTVKWIFPRHLYASWISVDFLHFRITCFRCFVRYLFYALSNLTGLRKAEASRERLFRFEIRWRERSKILVEFEKFYVVAADWKAALSTVFLGKILRQTTRTSARNYTVRETGEIFDVCFAFCQLYLPSRRAENIHNSRGWCLSYVFILFNCRFHFHMFIFLWIFSFLSGTSTIWL